MKKSLKILIINWQDILNPLAGGAEIHLHETTKRFVKKGHECILYCHRYPNTLSQEVVDGIQTYRQGHRLWFNVIVWLNVRKWIKKHNPDIIIDDTNKIPFLIPLFTKKPVAVRIHHLFRMSIFKEILFPIALIIYLLETFLLKVLKKQNVLTVSPSIKKEFISNGFSNVYIVYNGLNTKQYKSTIPKKNYCLVYVGRLQKYKQVSTLLYAIHQLKNEYPQVRLIIAGKGTYEQHLKNEVRQLGLNKFVTFKGFVSEQEKVAIYSQATIALNASLKEGWGLTTIEANACGTIVIGNNVEGLKDSIQNGKNGYLVSAQKPNEFAQKIKEVWDDPKKQRKMELFALEWAKNFNWDKTGDNLEKLLYQFINEKKH